MSDFLSQFETGDSNSKPQRQGGRGGERGGDRSGGQDVGQGFERDAFQSIGQDVEPDTPDALIPSSGSGGLSNSGGPGAPGGIRPVMHRVETDPGYRRRRVLRLVIILVAVIVLALAALLTWHFMRLVEVPELVGKPFAVAQEFSKENEITLTVTQEFSLEQETGTVVSQEVAAGEKLTKGATLAIAVSEGPDPDELLALPDFSTMTQTVAEQWITEHRADNLRMVLEFSSDVEEGSFIKLEFRGNETDSANYRRQDYATLYYSKGAEVFAKDIEVPDFTDKTRGEVETWATRNSIELTVEEADSEEFEPDSVISQSVSAGEKIAKHDAFTVTVSLGKAVIVPNFANFTAMTAAGAAESLAVSVETRYSDTVPYGGLISQSLAAGTRLMPGDEHAVVVIYSEGAPYLKDLQGMSEGELPAAFFDDYVAKGANITYETRYVNSAEPKGTVVAMSDHSRFVPLQFHVVVDVSKGNLKPKPESTDEDDSKTNSTPTGTSKTTTPDPADEDEDELG
ncbi:MAG: PASTA domain-containing protein [Coriobacteriales bacterium]|nr:PASTA domain-containing protein [Coriobacteriales bacterium]